MYEVVKDVDIFVYLLSLDYVLNLDFIKFSVFVLVDLDVVKNGNLWVFVLDYY